MFRRTSPFTEEVLLWARETAPEPVRACFRGARARPREVVVGALLFLGFAALYFGTGRLLMKADAPFGYGLVFGTDRLFGWDVPRVIGDMLVPGHNIRSNVHPLFVLVTKPPTLFFHRGLGLSGHTACIAVIATVQAVSVVLVYAYFLLFGAALVEAALFAAIFGASTIGWFSGVVPETGVFAILALVLVLLLAQLSIVHGRRSELAWLVVGIYTYGITITNVLKEFLAYGVTGIPFYRNRVRLFARSVVHGTTVVGVAVALTVLCGSSLHLIRDTWIVTPEERGGDLEGLPIRIAREFALNSVVGCVPSTQRVTFQNALRDDRVVTFNEGRYVAGQLPLVAAWVAMLGASLALAARRGVDPGRRTLAALSLAWLAWDFVFFSKYYLPYEGLFHWSVHVLPPMFLLTAFLARAISNAAPVARRRLRLAVGAFAVTLLANNGWVIAECVRMLVE